MPSGWEDEEEWFDMMVDFFVRGIFTEDEHWATIMATLEDPSDTEERLQTAIQEQRAKKSAPSALGKRDREGADLPENPRDTPTTDE